MIRCTWIPIAFLTLQLIVPTIASISDFITIKDVESDLDLERTRNVKKLNKTITSTRFTGPIPDLSRIDGSGIVGGYPIPFQMSRHLASLFIFTTSGSISFCTGSVLNRYLVLSAAHCFKGNNNRYNLAAVYLRFGKFSNKGKLYSAKYVDIFDQFNPRTTQNDVALVWFSGPIKTSYNTVLLPRPSYKLPIGSTVFAAGFGRTSTNGRSQGTAREVKLAYRSFFNCRKYWKYSLYKNWSPNRVMCTTDPKFPKYGRGGTCFGDSGGPMYRKINSKRMFQQGIISFGSRTCGGKGNMQWAVNLKTYVPFILQYANEKYGRWNEVYDYRD